MAERKALVIELDATRHSSLRGILRILGYECVAVSSAEGATAALAEGNFSFTLVDFSGNGTNHAAAIQGLRVRGRNSGPIIAVADSRDQTVDLDQLDADGLVYRPLSLSELKQALVALDGPYAEPLGHVQEQLAARLRRELNLWCNPKMLEAYRLLQEAAKVDVTILITGETGTGKELVARAAHQLSTRRAGPFIKVNCAAMPRELLESELFGHERGAFTGAHKLKVGKFEAAHRGTIFLDEIGDLHPTLQAKLLHVLQDGEFSRIGSKSPLTVDVRVLSATNQDLEQAVAEGRFRDDLYYRLNVVHVHVPPLRERIEEIPIFAKYFVERYSQLYQRGGFTIPQSVIDRLVRHPFPGNIRELENLVKRMIVLDDPLLTRIQLHEEPVGRRELRAPRPPVLRPSLKEIGRRASQAAERDAISKMLEKTGWNRVLAAKELRISYRALLYKMKQAGVRHELCEPSDERIAEL